MPTISNCDDLSRAILKRMGQEGPACDLNNIDVSRVEQFRGLFSKSPILRTFRGDISKWTPVRAKDTTSMFQGSEFNGDISQWSMPLCTSMAGMFHGSAFNGDISGWDVSGVRVFSGMFQNSPFTGDLSRWDMSGAVLLDRMFEGSAFNGSIAQWDVSRVGGTERMFKECLFAQDISQWGLRPDARMQGMFDNNRPGLAAQGMSPWTLAMRMDHKLPFSDQLWRKAAKRYELLEKSLGLDPTKRFEDVSAIHRNLVEPIESLPLTHLELGL